MTDVRPGRQDGGPSPLPETTDLRVDGAAALEWAASYLERVGELPVLAQVAPGEIRAQLPFAGARGGRAVLGGAA